jgi:uncharacterized protein YbjT (DUF2867 family)
VYIVLGATGHVGSHVAASLLAKGCPVTVVTRSEENAAVWRDCGAQAAISDVADVERLRSVFQTGKRAFILNPPALPSTDTDREEHRTVAAIVEALVDSGLEKVVVQSTYGAQAGTGIGDLAVLYELEQAVSALPLSTTIVRAAYYMSNWDGLLDAARAGTLPTMFPPDLSVPMVAPADLGRSAARLLQEPPAASDIRYVEGPERYTATDVAAAFAACLGRPVALAVTPPSDWEAAFRQLGFSPQAAASYTGMTAVTVEQRYELPAAPERGQIGLGAYISELALRGADGRD